MCEFIYRKHPEGANRETENRFVVARGRRRGAWGLTAPWVWGGLYLGRGDEKVLEPMEVGAGNIL